MEALQSVKNQVGTSPQQIEVVVTKNFDDVGIDSFLEREGFQNLSYTGETAGRQISDALDLCRAPLIALLDDDDRWDPRKVAVVQSRFASSPGLGYYGHALAPIDSTGHESLGTLKRSHEFYRWLMDGSIRWIDTHELTVQSIDSLFAANPGCNSCIVVPRSLYDEFRSYFQRIRTSVDHFLLTAALLRPNPLLIEHLALTQWRVHDENRSRVKTVGVADFFRDLNETAIRLGSDNEVFLDMARGVGNSSVARYLGHKVAALSRLRAITERRTDRIELLREVWTWMEGLRRREELDYWSRAGAMSTVAQSVSPTLAQTLLYLYMQNESKR